jgi:hypothetical protein
MRSRLLAILSGSALAVVLLAASAHAAPPRTAQKIFLKRSIDAQNAKVRG